MAHGCEPARRWLAGAVYRLERRAAPEPHCRPSTPGASAARARPGHKLRSAPALSSSAARLRRFRRGYAACRRLPEPRSSSARVKIIVELARHRPADARCLLEVVECGALHCARRAEMHQERTFAAWPDAGNLIERRGGQTLGSLGAVRPDREAVCLVAQTLEVELYRRIGRKGDLAAARQMKDFSPLPTVVRTLANAEDGKAVHAHFLHHVTDGRELPLTAIDQDEVWPRSE